MKNTDPENCLIYLTLLFAFSIIVTVNMYSSLCYELNTFAEYYSAGVPWYESKVGKEMIKDINKEFAVLQDKTSQLYQAASMLNAMISEANFH